LVPLRFIKQNGHCRYKYIVLWRGRSYFVKKKKTLILPKISLKLRDQPLNLSDLAFTQLPLRVIYSNRSMIIEYTLLVRSHVCRSLKALIASSLIIPSLILPKISLKLILSTWSRFLLTIYLLFGGQSVYIYGCKMCSSSRRFVLLLAWFWLQGYEADLSLSVVALISSSMA
jgi:hypothetical protein